MERAFLLEGLCMPTVSTQGIGSYRYYSYDGGLCKDEFADKNCETLLEECVDPVPYDQCDTAYSRSGTRFKDWCIESSGPSGDFVSPLIRRSYWYNEPTCSDTNEFGTALAFVDPKVCWSTSVVNKSHKRVQGTALSHCNESGDLVTKLFTSSKCDLSSPLPLYAEASFPNDTCEGLQNKVTTVLQTDCSSPRFYCKSLVGEVAGFASYPVGASSSPTLNWAVVMATLLYLVLN